MSRNETQTTQHECCATNVVLQTLRKLLGQALSSQIEKR